MGQEINEARFSRQDFITFHQRLAEETALLGEWFQQGRFDPGPPVAGFELEAWLVDERLRPAPVNAQFIQRLGSPLQHPAPAAERPHPLAHGRRPAADLAAGAPNGP